MKRIAVFGGAFNPPHLGHLRLLRHLNNRFHFDRIHVIPTALPSHKILNGHVPFQDRLYMTALNFSSISNMTVDDHEARMVFPSYTVNTLARILDRRNDNYLIIGEDQAMVFKKWYKYRDILETVKIIVVKRKNLGKKLSFPHILIADKIYTGSSTVIRNQIAEGKSPPDLSHRVYDYIYASGLFRSRCDFVSGLENHVRTVLDTPRFNHTLSVMNTAADLGYQYGLNIWRLKIAALFHDYCKNESRKNVVQYYDFRYQKMLALLLGRKSLFHSFHAAAIARRRFDIHDPDILAGIRFHTLGKSGMNDFSKIIYLADFCEPARKYPAAREVYRLAKIDIDQAMLFTLLDIADRHGKKAFHPRARKLLNELRLKVH